MLQAVDKVCFVWKLEDDNVKKNHQPSCFWQIVHFSVWIEEVK